MPHGNAQHKQVVQKVARLVNEASLAEVLEALADYSHGRAHFLGVEQHDRQGARAWLGIAGRIAHLAAAALDVET